MLETIRRKLAAGRRLEAADGIQLYRQADLWELARLAEEVTLERVGANVYYCINRHINYTNVCTIRCAFCGFSRLAIEREAYTLGPYEAAELAEEAYRRGAGEVHIVGGVNPALSWEYYLEMLDRIRQACPDLHIKAFTAVEIVQLARLAGLAIEQTLETLVRYGLQSLPGGGAEILDQDYFDRYCPNKPGPDAWLEVHRTAHRIGLPTNATMLYGYTESIEQRIGHLLRLRDLQDESLAADAQGRGRFQCFIPLPYVRPQSTAGIQTAQNGQENDDSETGTEQLALEPTSPASEREGSHPAGPPEQIDVVDDLKTVAISRLLLDNFDHVKAFWPMLGVKTAQIALAFGANDLDGTVRQYRVVQVPDEQARDGLTVEQIEQMVRQADRTPVRRDGYYRPVE